MYQIAVLTHRYEKADSVNRRYQNTATGGTIFALLSYKYNREQELESDIIAYRFCEWIGIGGYSYIMALQMLGDNDLYLTADPTSDHPTTLYRVLLLKYLFEKDKEQEAAIKRDQNIRRLHLAISKEPGVPESVYQFKDDLKKESNLKKYYEISKRVNFYLGSYESFVQMFQVK